MQQVDQKLDAMTRIQKLDLASFMAANNSQAPAPAQAAWSEGEQQQSSKIDNSVGPANPAASKQVELTVLVTSYRLLCRFCVVFGVGVEQRHRWLHAIIIFCCIRSR